MVSTGIFATDTEVRQKTGNGIAAEVTESFINAFALQAESFINVFCRYNFSDNYASLNDDVRNLLKMVASDLEAIYCIQYDMSGYTSRTEAEDMINVLRDSALRGLSVLRDKKAQDFINGA